MVFTFQEVSNMRYKGIHVSGGEQHEVQTAVVSGYEYQPKWTMIIIEEKKAM